MVFAENQERNESYIFKDMLLQPYKSDFIIDTIKEVEAHKSIIYWALMKTREFNYRQKNRDGKLNNF